MRNLDDNAKLSEMIEKSFGDARTDEQRAAIKEEHKRMVAKGSPVGHPGGAGQSCLKVTEMVCNVQQVLTDNSENPEIITQLWEEDAQILGQFTRYASVMSASGIRSDEWAQSFIQSAVAVLAIVRGKVALKDV